MRANQKNFHDKSKTDESKRVSVLVIGAGASGLMAGISAASSLSGSSGCSSFFPDKASRFCGKYEDGAPVKAGEDGGSEISHFRRRERTTVVIADGNDKPGNKLYATGNGRCNFTNINCGQQDYNKAGDGFVESVLSRFGPQDTIRFFEAAGMMSRVEKDGRCYPYSGQASSLVSALSRAAHQAGCEMILSDRVVRTGRVSCAAGNENSEIPMGTMRAGTSFHGENRRESTDSSAKAHGDSGLTTGATLDENIFYDEGWREDTDSSEVRFFAEFESGRRIYCTDLIIACGGRAGLKTGSTGDGYGFAKSFGHTLNPPRPALTAAESEDRFLVRLKGVRARGSVSLYEDGKKRAEEYGEIQFTGTGVSGICVFDLTRFMEAPRPSSKSKRKKKTNESDENGSYGHKYEIHCDFVPEKSETELTELISEGIFSKNRTLEEVLTGFLNDRLAAVIAEMTDSDNMDIKITDTARIIKNFIISVSHTRGWEEAQVTCGGVRRQEINPLTMESKLVPGLYFCGEVVDVDGRCGGCNLQWAWSSGMIAGRRKGENGG